MKKTTLVGIKRRSDGSVDFRLSSGAIGNFDNIHQGYDWATMWCGVSRKQFKEVLLNTPENIIWMIPTV